MGRRNKRKTGGKPESKSFQELPVSEANDVDSGFPPVFRLFRLPMDPPLGRTPEARG